MIKCIAVDDETLALDLLEDNIKRIPFLDLVGRYKNGYDVMKVLQTEAVDLIFLDIQMPNITGVQLLQSLTTKPMIIFITAYKEYALEGFNLDVLDYLVKPVSFERFLKASNKALELFNLKTKQQLAVNVHVDDFVFVTSEYNLIKIELRNILYIEGLKDYIKIFLSTSKSPVVTRLSMKLMEEKFPSERFVRVHKSFIISVDKITSIRNSQVFIGEHEIPVSDHFRSNLTQAVKNKSIRK